MVTDHFLVVDTGVVLEGQMGVVTVRADVIIYHSHMDGLKMHRGKKSILALFLTI